KVDNPTPRGDPNSPSLVFEQGQSIRIRKSLSGAINGDLAVLPSVQTIQCAKPDAPVAGVQYRADIRVGQALFFGDGRNRELTKTVETIPGANPDIGLAILEQAQNVIA